jgi:hypothetical protein
MQWLDLADDRIEVRGLAWWDENNPHLWRLPGRCLDDMPKGVQTQARFPAGARISLMSDTGELCLRVSGVSNESKLGLDVYVDGRYLQTSTLPPAGQEDVTCFKGLDQEMKSVEVHLPYRRSLQVNSVGVGDGSSFGELKSDGPPLVLYGSSVAQGVGATRSGMSYLAIMSRALGMDYINLGFGGAGKAESEVVELVSETEASVLLFDLGKSYGLQSGEVFYEMLKILRTRHPNVPMVCLTPIYSTRERRESEYRDLSEHTRSVMRDAVASRVADGEKDIVLVEGLELLGEPDADGLSADGVHPNELGFADIAGGIIDNVPHLRERIKDGK